MKSWKCGEFEDLEKVLCDFLSDSGIVTPHEVVEAFGGEEDADVDALNEAMEKLKDENLVTIDEDGYIIWKEELNL